MDQLPDVDMGVAALVEEPGAAVNTLALETLPPVPLRREIKLLFPVLPVPVAAWWGKDILRSFSAPSDACVVFVKPVSCLAPWERPSELEEFTRDEGFPPGETILVDSVSFSELRAPGDADPLASSVGRPGVLL